MTDDRDTAARTRRSAILVMAILAVALLAWCVVQLACGDARAFGSSGAAGNCCVRVVDGDGTAHELPLGEDGTHTFATSFGTNTIEISDGTVRMASADCPNHDCVEQGALHDGTGMIVCMPHQLIVTVVEGAAS